MPARPNLSQYASLSFDCYGTLIDWNAGLLSALRPLAARAKRDVTDTGLLRLYASAEAAAEATFRPYADVLRAAATEIAKELGVDPDPDAILDSFSDWPAFPDTRPALETLSATHHLIVLSNVDDALFAETQKTLGVDFDAVITAQQVGAYKPSARMFDALEARLPHGRERHLHVAQSLFHDIAPCRDRGLAAVWVRRDTGAGRFGATRRVDVDPEFAVADLRELVG